MANKLTADDTDCYQKLEPTEEYFCLMARDPDFDLMIRMWAFHRRQQIVNGVRADTKENNDQISEALATAKRGKDWRDAWLLKKEMDDLVFNEKGYPLNGPNAVKMTTTSGQEINRLPTSESIGVRKE
jgi:hypothetical protein